MATERKSAKNTSSSSTNMALQLEGIRHIGDGLLEVGKERLKEFLADGDINDLYDVEQTPFARYVITYQLVLIFGLITNTIAIDKAGGSGVFFVGDDRKITCNNWLF